MITTDTSKEGLGFSSLSPSADKLPHAGGKMPEYDYPFKLWTYDRRRELAKVAVWHTDQLDPQQLEGLRVLVHTLGDHDNSRTISDQEITAMNDMVNIAIENASQPS